MTSQAADPLDPLDPVDPPAAPDAQAARAGQDWIRRSLARHGLALMLDRPIRSTWAGIRRWAFVLFGYTAGLALVGNIAILVIAGAYPRSGGRQTTSAGITTLRTVLLVVFALVIAPFLILAFRVTLKEWRRVGSSLAVMLSFVVLTFLTSDMWRITGLLPWWRLRTFVVVFSLVSIAVLFGRSRATIARHAELLETDVSWIASIKEPVVRDLIAAKQYPRQLRPTGKALFNLRVMVMLLLRRIGVSGMTVTAALFVFGLIMVGPADTAHLLNVHSAATAGYVTTFGFGKYRFFLSEALVKVALSLGAIAAAFFVLTNPDATAEQTMDTHIAAFIRRNLALWACYTHLAELAPGAVAPVAADGILGNA